MPETAPVISVVMPVYNAERYLRPAVESIQAQTFGDFEFLITDDASQDSSWAILQEYAKHDGRIMLARQHRNMGHTKILNQSIEKARGKYIARMDADDIALPERFAKQVTFLDQHADHVAVGNRILLVDEANLPIRELCYEQTHDEIERKHLEGGGAVINHPSSMFRIGPAKEVGAYRESTYPAEDLDLWLRMAEVGKLANLPEVLTRYRVHSKSISHAKAAVQRAKWREAVIDARKRRGYPADQLEPPPIPSHETGLTVGDHHIRWAWMALMNGHLQSARKHAFAGVRCKPFSFEAWRLACCAIRGH